MCAAQCALTGIESALHNAHMRDSQQYAYKPGLLFGRIDYSADDQRKN